MAMKTIRLRKDILREIQNNFRETYTKKISEARTLPVEFAELVYEQLVPPKLEAELNAQYKDSTHMPCIKRFRLACVTTSYIKDIRRPNNELVLRTKREGEYIRELYSTMRLELPYARPIPLSSIAVSHKFKNEASNYNTKYNYRGAGHGDSCILVSDIIQFMVCNEKEGICSPEDRNKMILAEDIPGYYGGAQMEQYIGPEVHLKVDAKTLLIREYDNLLRRIKLVHDELYDFEQLIANLTDHYKTVGAAINGIPGLQEYLPEGMLNKLLEGTNEAKAKAKTKTKERVKPNEVELAQLKEAMMTNSVLNKLS